MAVGSSHDPTLKSDLISEKLSLVEMRVLVCCGCELLCYFVRLGNHLTLKLNELLFFLRSTGTTRRAEITQVPTHPPTHRRAVASFDVFCNSEILDNFKMAFRAGPGGSLPFSFCS